MKPRLLFIACLVVLPTWLLASGPAIAQYKPILISDPLHKPASPDEIEAMIDGAAVHVDDGVACVFAGGGEWVCEYAMGSEEAPTGTWSLEDNVITAQAEESKMDVTYDFRFEVEAVSDWGVLVGKKGEAGKASPAVLALGPYPSEERNVLYDEQVTCKLVRGNKDRTIYKALRKSSYVPFPTFAAKPAKNQRQVSEIWYLDGFERAAWAAADGLRPVIGMIEPKRWEWGGPYGLIIISGAEKGKLDKGSVVILDSTCEDDKPCDSAMAKRAAEKVEAAGWKVSRRVGVKKRASSAIYYRKGMAKPVEALAKDHLNALLGTKGATERKGSNVWWVPTDCSAVVYLGYDLKRDGK